ncbi:MAG: Beta-glucosidase [Rhizobium sp.]|nr:Beta-glucosidase [Rhizobium sp.]
MSSIANRHAALIDRVGEIRFPKDFIFGSATAAYQIEGAMALDGKGESIWDRFTRRPGVIVDGSNGDIACDHYHLYPRDIALMREMGLKAYRFSLSWPRLLPQGSGRLNQKGAEFYDRLIDALLAEDIEPFVTLYHWDLPQALQDKGGWYSRDTAMRFADYAAQAAGLLGDRVSKWTTLNEPWTFCWSGHALGEDAPGLADGVKGGVASSHHALLAHGLAVPMIRAEARGAEVGITLDLNVTEPATDRQDDIEAAARFDGAQNRWYLESIFRGVYPEDMLDLYGEKYLPRIEPEDLKAISAPIDFLGINNYRRSVIKAGSNLPPLNFQRVSPQGSDYTPLGWEIWPQAIEDILIEVNDKYKPACIYITENGMATKQETPDDKNRIEDFGRANYYVGYIGKVASAVEKGVPVKGYFAWTLMDNFEWALGYTAPFGLVHVDFETQERRLKLSGEIFGQIAREAPGR